MERAVVHSDLKKQEIQPDELLKNYKSLLAEDIQRLFSDTTLQQSFCPVSNEREVRDSFTKLGMEYKVSSSLGNIYLSPRPSADRLKQFYLESRARRFWLTELWSKTKTMRVEKIILPQLEWVKGFLAQYGPVGSVTIGEFLPNHWGYGAALEKVLPNAEYFLINPVFDTNKANRGADLQATEQVQDVSLDAALLFEALDRAVNPRELLASVKKALKPGGLCFVTCLLASGFEVQVLGERSGIFVPPERMNLLSFEGMHALIKSTGGLEVLEFSTPGVLDIPNVIAQIDEIDNVVFFDYLFRLRQDPALVESFQDFLQLNRLGTFGRLVLKKQ